MSRLLLGSINLTELSQKVKSGEIDVFTSEKTGVKYVNVAMWINDNPNEWGQVASLSHRNEKGNTTYLGNFKDNNPQGGQARQTAPQANADDLDFLND